MGGTTIFWGPGFSPSIQQTADDGFIIIGTTQLSVNVLEALLVKTDSVGNILWSKIYGTGSVDYYSGRSVQQTTDGGFVIGGFIYAAPSGLLIKTDSNGNTLCNQGSLSLFASTPATQVLNPALIISSGGIVTNPAPIVGSIGIDSTICTNVGINEITKNIFFTISPNPSSENFIISFERTISKGKVEILNILGVPIDIGIAENIFNESKKEINLKNICAGIYFVKVFDGEKYYCKKIIIESP